MLATSLVFLWTSTGGGDDGGLGAALGVQGGHFWMGYLGVGFGDTTAVTLDFLLSFKVYVAAPSTRVA